MRKKRILALIPARLKSKRLPIKAILPIKKIPMVIHVYQRALLSKKIHDVLICTCDQKILSVSNNYRAKAILTSKKHVNGTERICEAYKKIKKNFDLIIDIQGDEPLINPHHIDQVIDCHLKNFDADIILPNIKIKPQNNKNIVKLVANKKNEVLYLSRADIPINFKKKVKTVKKHLSIISFKPSALLKFAKAKISEIEKIEGVELLRALEIGLKIKTITLDGDRFSVDVMKDYNKAKKQMKYDKFFKLYKNNFKK